MKNHISVLAILPVQLGALISRGLLQCSVLESGAGDDRIRVACGPAGEELLSANRGRMMDV